MNLEDLKVGMKIKVGSRHAGGEGYKRIVGKEAAITHLGYHPNNYRHTTDSQRVYVHVEGHDGGYFDDKMKIASWHIMIDDVILIDNESCIEALPIW